MKKLLFCLLLAPCFASAQVDLPKIVDDTLFTSSGYRAVAGTDIKLGNGTLPNGDFKYVTTSRGPMIGPSDPRRRPEPAGISWAGHMFHIKRFHKDGNSKRGYTYFLVLGAGGLVNFLCDVENAIASGELVVPDEYRPKTAQAGVAPVSPVDQLKKLKDLLDAGAINQNEYDSAKKKILAKM